MFQFRGPDDLLLAGLAVVCAITDLRRHRIYDFVTMPAIAAGLAFALAQGPGEAALAAAGAAAGALVLYPGYRIGAVGDGDLKMLAAVGAIGGPILLGSAMVFSTLSGGLYSIVRTAMAGELLPTLRRSLLVALYMFNPARSARTPRGLFSGSAVIPFGAFIAMGVIVARILRWPW